MKLKDFYADVVSRLNEMGERDYNFTYLDVVKCINDAIRSLRVEYINQGRYQDFTITENIFTTVEDFDYPFLSSFELDKPIISEIPFQNSIISINVRPGQLQISDSNVTLTKGTIGIKDDKAFVLVESVNNVNTFGKEFDICDVRHYYPENTLKYRAGDVVLNTQDGSYYKVESDFISGVDSPNLTKLYWKYLYSADKPGYFREVKNLQELRTADLWKSGSFNVTMLGNKLYTFPKANRITITYIPKWTQVMEREDEVNIPDYMVPEVKNLAVRTLMGKIMVEQNEG